MPRTHPPYAPEYRRRIIELARDLGVDRLRRALIVASPAIDQAPTRPLRDVALEARGHDEMLICRRNIPARPIAGV